MNLMPLMGPERACKDQSSNDGGGYGIVQECGEKRVGYSDEGISDLAALAKIGKILVRILERRLHY